MREAVFLKNLLWKDDEKQSKVNEVVVKVVFILKKYAIKIAYKTKLKYVFSNHWRSEIAHVYAKLRTFMHKEVRSGHALNLLFFAKPVHVVAGMCEIPKQ